MYLLKWTSELELMRQIRKRGNEATVGRNLTVGTFNIPKDVNIQMSFRYVSVHSSPNPCKDLNRVLG